MFFLPSIWKPFVFSFLLGCTPYFIYQSLIRNVNCYIGVVLLAYFGIEIGSSIAHHRYCTRLTKDLVFYEEECTENSVSSPKVCVCIVGYREDETFWRKCLDSVWTQKYDHLIGIYAFVDGDTSADLYMQDIFLDVMQNYVENATPTAECTLLPHRGKRHALAYGIQTIIQKHGTPLRKRRTFSSLRASFEELSLNEDNDFIIVMDSDTILEGPNAILNLVRPLVANPQIGCATSHVKIYNQNNFLTRIIEAKYAYSFLIQRAAMSTFGCMNCCSGPFSVYRQSVFEQDPQILDDFIHQSCCGHDVVAGDDRHLTNLVLGKGHRSIISVKASCLTETPDTLFRFIPQQIRWARSFFREQYFQIKAIPHQSFYLIVVTYYELMFAFFILCGLLQNMGILHPKSHPLWVLLQQASICLGAITIRTMTLVSLTRQIKYCYGFFLLPLFFLVLLPIKLYAMLTCVFQHWMTSSRRSKFMICTPDLGLFFVWHWFWVLGVIFVVTFPFYQDYL